MYIATCFCGVVDQRLPCKLNSREEAIEAPLCHCDLCRHATGMLCMAYYPLLQRPDTKNTTMYQSFAGDTRYFCSTCGCHLFRSQSHNGKDAEWSVATGAVVGLEDNDTTQCRFSGHRSVEDTIDGGASAWINLPEMIAGNSVITEISASRDQRSSQDVLPASCACGTVAFHITRPDAESLRPHSGFPDLSHPYCTTDPAITKNPSKEKWWICGEGGDKYLAGTCACASCRKASGFEIQAWAFVPRTNIAFYTEGSSQTLDFRKLQGDVLHTYRSSDGVAREFCGVCGATVFWHDEHRPDVVDVSVGLLRATEGVRAESWLEWWTDRVSFAEEASTGRSGPPAEAARELLGALEKGLKVWKPLKMQTG